MTVAINILGGPGVGKSWIAAGLFYLMKTRGYSCELVTEYAKELTWENNPTINKSGVGVFNRLYHQDIIVGEQYSRIARLIDKVDYIVTDSPVILGLLYENTRSHALQMRMVELFNMTENINFLISKNPDVEFENSGRYHDAEQSSGIHDQLKNILQKYNIQHVDHVSHETLPWTLLNHIQSSINT